MSDRLDMIPVDDAEENASPKRKNVQGKVSKILNSNIGTDLVDTKFLYEKINHYNLFFSGY